MIIYIILYSSGQIKKNSSKRLNRRPWLRWQVAKHWPGGSWTLLVGGPTRTSVMPAVWEDFIRNVYILVTQSGRAWDVGLSTVTLSPSVFPAPCSMPVALEFRFGPAKPLSHLPCNLCLQQKMAATTPHSEMTVLRCVLCTEGFPTVLHWALV